MISLSQSEILEALNVARAGPVQPTDTFTVAEIVKATGRDPGTIRGQLMALMQGGSVECVKVKRPTLDGRNMLLPSYRFLKRKKKP